MSTRGDTYWASCFIMVSKGDEYQILSTNVTKYIFYPDKGTPAIIKY